MTRYSANPYEQDRIADYKRKLLDRYHTLFGSAFSPVRFDRRAKCFEVRHTRSRG